MKTLVELMRRGLKSLRRCTSGNVALMFALSLPVIFLTVGGAIDFSRMMQLRSQMQDAVDAASVGSVGINSQAFKAGIAMTSDGTITVGSSQAQNIFNSNVRSSTDLTGVAFAATVAKSGTTIKSTVTVTGNYQTTILKLFGFNSLPITITSVSTVTVPPYIDFYLLLDNSPSMGVGATTNDINTMVANTPDQCAFACHELDKPSTGPNMDYYDLAKSLGVTTRIDVVRQATQNLMTTAKNTETLVNQYRMAIYDFGLSAATIDPQAPTAYQVSSLNANLSTSSSNAAAIDLMTMPSQGYNSDRETNFSSTLASMNSLIPAAGSGLTASNPQEVLFMVSDGATDSYDCGYSDGNTCRRITPMDNTTCTALKARGVRIAVLYTTYLPLPTNSFYNTYLAKYVAAPSQLASNMQSCATPGLYFEVSPSQGISSAMNALFQKVVSVVRINS